MVLVCEMKKRIINDKVNYEYEYDNAYFNSATHENLQGTKREKKSQEAFEEILQNLGTYIESRSNWIFIKF